MIRKLLSNVLVVSLLLTLVVNTVSFAPKVNAASLSAGDYVPGELLVKFKDGFSPDAAFNLKYGVKFKEKVSDDLLVMKLNNPTVDLNSAMALLSSAKQIEYSQPNFIYRVASASDNPLMGYLWGLSNSGQSIEGGVGIQGADIWALKAWQNSGFAYNDEITVCIIDTGIIAHADLPPLDSRNRTTLNDPIVTGAADEHGHGTHIAGIIGAKDNREGVIGVNPMAKIVAIKALDSSGQGTSATVTRAIKYAKDICKIANLSWQGNSDDPSLRNAITQAPETLFIVPSGNGLGTILFPVGINIDITPVYPAAYSNQANVISVAATDNRDIKIVESNFGSLLVQIAAPGRNIVSTSKNPDNAYEGHLGYEVRGGTSQAAAYVAGSVSLILKDNLVGPSPSAIKERLIRTVDPLPSLTGTTSSGGRLNLDKFIKDALIQPPTHIIQL